MLITAVIPVFNRAHSVARAIDSVLAQELPPEYKCELLVVDDGSSDDLSTALQPFGSRVTRLKHDENRGAAAARNTGVAAAADGLIAFLDSDDIWLRGKLATQIAAMKANNWRASCTAYYLLRPGRSALVSPQYRSGFLNLSDLAWGSFVSPGSTLVFEKSLFAEIGPLDTTMQRLEDWDWLLRYAQRHKLGFVAQPLAEIDPSRASQIAPVLDAAQRMKVKHIARLSEWDRRRLLAGLELACSSTYYGQRAYGAAAMHVLKSIWRVPVGNQAVSAVLHNFLSR